MSELLNTTKIENPTNKTYFICWNSELNKITGHGVVLPNQVMETKSKNVDSYKDREFWKNTLLENDIYVNEVKHEIKNINGTNK